VVFVMRLLLLLGNETTPKVGVTLPAKQFDETEQSQ
jgi:hypothetical protein